MQSYNIIIILYYPCKQECQYIKITDIVHEPIPQREQSKLVTVTFIPEMAENWREKYNVNKAKCKYIQSNESVTEI